MSLDTTNPFNVKVDHNFAKIDDAIGFFLGYGVQQRNIL